MVYGSVKRENGEIYEVSSDGTYVPSNQRIPISDAAWENVEKQTVEWLPKVAPVVN